MIYVYITYIIDVIYLELHIELYIYQVTVSILHKEPANVLASWECVFRGARGSSEGSYQAKAEIGQQQGQQPAARPRTGQPLHGLHLAKQLLPDALVGGIPLGQLTGPYTHQKRRGQCIWMYTLSHACRLWEAGSALFKANVPIRLLL